jgi:sterol desaturase/sphingolipid hydroxylase (fatty acid hydroxylase superfamily)
LCDGNYGNVLLFWDRLFGTDVTGAEPPPLMGIDGDQRLENSLLGLQLLRPEGGRS